MAVIDLQVTPVETVYPPALPIVTIDPVEDKEEVESYIQVIKNTQ